MPDPASYGYYGQRAGGFRPDPVCRILFSTFGSDPDRMLFFFFFFSGTGSGPDYHYRIRIGSIFVHLVRFRFGSGWPCQFVCGLTETVPESTRFCVQESSSPVPANRFRAGSVAGSAAVPACLLGTSVRQDEQQPDFPGPTRARTLCCSRGIISTSFALEKATEGQGACSSLVFHVFIYECLLTGCLFAVVVI